MDPQTVLISSAESPATVDSNLRDSALIDTHGSFWNEALIRGLSSSADFEEILAISLGNSRHADKLTWHYNTDGLFSVQSAHHLAESLASLHAASPSAERQNGWSFIWNRFTPPKAMGDTLHLILLCPLSRQVWALLNIYWTVVSDWRGNIESWFRGVVERVSGTMVGRALTADAQHDSLLGNLIDDVRLRRNFSSCLFRYIPRNLNELAHTLARSATLHANVVLCDP
ncbi:hypothetical protein Salat_0216100 [Sesamum alatum]|uniref:RNase H type-1 domain-containing protein n=1 Tax=Sesamum alatum TaxID=300844 RepID=A0AAE2CY90_9LAMI|nr:hypothetical protein Salat_0216100 [Sesamum alatum]